MNRYYFKKSNSYNYLNFYGIDNPAKKIRIKHIIEIIIKNMKIISRYAFNNMATHTVKIQHGEATCHKKLKCFDINLKAISRQFAMQAVIG